MRAELRDSLEFLFDDSAIARKPCRSMALDVARGGTISAHILLNDLDKGSKLRATLRHGGRRVPSARWFRLVHVPVEVNTGPIGFIEKEGECNKFVIRRAPFRVADAMEPVAMPLKTSAPTMALRVQLAVPRDGKPGQYKYLIELNTNRHTEQLKMTVTVHRCVIPDTGERSFPYTNWFSLGLMASRHGLKPWTEPHWRMIERYAALMAHGRQNTFWCTLGDIFSVRQNMPVLNRDRLRRIVRIFTKAGMYYIEGGHVAGRTGGEWEAKTFDTTLIKTRATTPAGNAVIAAIARQLMDEIDRNGWTRRWIQHVTDEPVQANAADYRILVGMVRKYMPGIPILDATMDPALVGSVDIWCPQAQEFQRHRDEFESQRKVGDRIWFYTCCFPGGPWLNRLLDMELLRPALFGWAAALFGLDGFLHWGLNQYRPAQDPFKKSVVPHGGSNSLPAGDTHIVYPGKDGPWSSLRLEAQREGFEDLDLLRQLKEKRPAAVRRLIRPVLRGFDSYTRDVNVFRAARKALLNSF